MLALIRLQEGAQPRDGWRRTHSQDITLVVPLPASSPVKVLKGPTEFIDQKAYFSRAGGFRGTVVVAEEFQDPELRRAIGEAGLGEERVASLTEELAAESEGVLARVRGRGGKERTRRSRKRARRG